MLPILASPLVFAQQAGSRAGQKDLVWALGGEGRMGMVPLVLMEGISQLPVQWPVLLASVPELLPEPGHLLFLVNPESDSLLFAARVCNIDPEVLLVLDILGPVPEVPRPHRHNTELWLKMVK